MTLLRKRGLFEAGKVVYLSVNEITPSPDQPRRRMEPLAMRELSASIAKYGVLQPLSVRRVQGGYELVSGERRMRAAMLAGLKEVPCVIMDVDTRQSAVLALVENLQRRGLDFIEEARGLSRLIGVYGYTQEEIARVIGLSQSTVANKLRLLKLPQDILYLIKEAGLTERHARALLRLPSEDDILPALEEIIKGDMNVADTDAYIDSLLSDTNHNQGAEKPGEPVIFFKDARLLLNTISRGVKMMRQSGINADCTRSDSESEIVLTIKIPKNNGR